MYFRIRITFNWHFQHNLLFIPAIPHYIKLNTEYILADPDADLKRCIACLSFILTSAARFTCDPGVLGNELQQLGLPREHSQSIRKVYVDHNGTLTGALRAKSFRGEFVVFFISSYCRNSTHYNSLFLFYFS